MTTAITVPFHGANLFVIEHNGQPYTPMKPIVEGMGLDWATQYRKIMTNQDRWGIVKMTIPTLGALQDAICMPLRKLAGWLMTIHPNKVKPQIRDTILKYQNECDDVLWQYWTEGQVIRPCNADETLLPSEQQTLSEIVHKRAEGYGELQGKALAEIWSRVHRKFRVARYSQLPRTQLSEAILYVTGMEIKTGTHEVAEEYITHAQYHELKHLVYLIGDCFRRKNQAEHHAWSTVRMALPVEAAAKIPASRYEEARALLKDLERVSEAFNHAVMALEQKFFKRHFAELPSEFEEIEQGLLN